MKGPWAEEFPTKMLAAQSIAGLALPSSSCPFRHWVAVLDSSPPSLYYKAFLPECSAFSDVQYLLLGSFKGLIILDCTLGSLAAPAISVTLWPHGGHFARLGEWFPWQLQMPWWFHDMQVTIWVSSCRPVPRLGCSPARSLCSHSRDLRSLTGP